MASQKYGEIEYSVGFSIDNQSLQELKRNLQEIANMTTQQYRSANFDGTKNQSFEQSRKELVAIKKEAQLVEDALKKAFNPSLGNTNISKFSQSLKGVDINKLYRDLQMLGPQGVSTFRSLTTGLTTMNIHAKESHKLLDDMATSLKNTVKWGISSSVYNTLSGSLQKAWSYAKNLDSALNDIRVVSGQSAQEMEKFAIQANRAAQSLGASTLDYAKASLIYFQQGLSTQEANERAEVTIKMANVLGASAQEVSDYMTAIWNNFDNGSKSLEYFADVITALGATTASSSEEIAQGLEKFASIANTVGLSYEYATAALATVVAQTRQSADTVGTAFKTIFARIQDLELGKTLDDGTTLGKYAEALQKVGINIKNQYGELKDMNTILDEMGKKWETLSKAQKVALAENVAGTRQYSQLMALMDNWDLVEKNISTANNAMGTLEEKQNIYLESTEAHLTKLSTATERLMASFINNKGINSLVDGLTSVVQLVSNFVESIGGGGNALLMLGSIGSQVFSNQIAQGLGITIRNLQKTKQYANDAQTAINNLNLIKNSEGMQDPVVKELVPTLERFQSSMMKMDQESINEITQLINTLEKLLNERDLEEVKFNDAGNLLKNVTGTNLGEELSEDQSIQLAEQAQEKLTEAIRGTNKVKAEGLKQDEQQILSLEEAFKLVEEKQAKLNTDYNARTNKITEEDRKNGIKLWSELYPDGKGKGQVITDDIEEMRQALDDATKSVDLFVDRFGDAMSTEVVDKLKNKIAALQEQLKDPEKYIYNVKGSKSKKDRRNFDKNVVESYNSMKKTAKEVADTLEKDTKNAVSVVSDYASKEHDKNAKKRKNEIKNTKEQIEGAISAQEQIINIEQWVRLASGIGQAASALSAIGNIGNIFSNENLSTGEKLLQLITTLATSTAMLGNSLKLVKDNFGVLLNSIKQLAVNYYTQAAATDKATASTVKKTVAEKAAATSIQKVAASDAAAVAANNKLSISNIGVGATLKGVVMAAKQALVALGPYLLIAAAIGVAGYAIYQAATRDEREYESLKTAQDNLNKSAEELSTSIQDLKQSWESLKGAENVLDSCVTYSTEWNEQLRKVNEAVESILKKYPDLLNIEGIVKNTNGRLSLDENKVNDYLQQQEKTLEAINKASYVNQLQMYNKNREGALKRGTIQTQWGSPSKSPTITLTEEEQRSLGQVGLSNKDYQLLVQQIAQSYIDKNGGESNNFQLSKIVDELKNSQGTFQEIVKTLDSIDRKIDNVKTVLTPDKIKEAGAYASQLWEDQSDIDSITKKVLKAEAKGVYGGFSGRYDEDAIIFMKMYQKAIGQEFDQAKFTNVGGTDSVREYEYNGNSMTRQQMAAVISAYLAAGNKFDESEIFAEDTSQTSRDYYNDELKQIYKEAPSEEKILKQSQEAIEKVAEKYNIDEKLADKILARDVNNLTPEDIEKINEILKADENLEQGLKDLGVKIVESDKIPSIKDFLNNVKSGKYEKNAEAYQKSQIEQIYQGGAESTGETVAGLKDIAVKLKSVNKETKLSEEQWAKYAVTAAKFSKNMDAVSKKLDSSKDLLKEWVEGGKNYEKVSRDARLAAEEFQTTIKDSFGVELPLEVIRDKFSVIEKAIKGDKKALTEFQKILAETSFKSKITWNPDIELSEEAKNTAVENFNKGIDSMVDQTKDWKIGAVFDDSQAIADMNDFLEKSNWTKEQANAYFEEIGFDADIETVKRQVVSISYIPIGDTGMSIPIPTIHEVEVPIIKSAKKARNVSSYKPSSSGSGKKSGGGSSNKPKKVDKIDDEFDRYHKVNTQITKVNNSLQKLQSQQEKFVGGKLISNLTKQWDLLNTQINNYNEKLRIANDEQDELRKKLSSQGVQFNADGTVSNYMGALQAQENRYNKLVEQYNGLSKKQQEKWDENNVLDNAKKQYEDFKKNIDRYDELVSDFIPQLEQSIQDSIDKQIEINIQKFNMEIEITLNMNKATRDWNEWKKRIIKGIKEDDILGNARARVLDFSTYYNENGTGDIQSSSRHVSEVLGELYKMDAGEANKYGDNRAQALEDLKTYYTQLMESMTEMDELRKEIHQAVLDEMDEVAEKFNDQIQSYQLVDEILTHDMKMIQLAFGEDSYGELSKFYEKQQENYNKQLDFQRQQVDFWREQMDMAEEGSDVWLKAKDEWVQATQDFNKTFEESLQNAIDKFKNAINEVFQEMNNLVTNGKGLDFVKEEWDLINKNADRYLDSINATYATRQLEKKYLDAINKTDNVAAQQKLKKIMDEQLTDLQAKDRLTQYDVDRANKMYEIELARLALEDARLNKSQMRLRRDSQGNYTYQYVTNQEEVEKAQDKLAELQNSLYNFDKDRYNAILNDAYASWEEYQQKMAEAALINDPELRAEKERLIQEQYNELMTQIEQDYLDSKYNLQESAFEDWKNLNNLSEEAFRTTTNNEKDIILKTLVPTWENGVSDMVDYFIYGENKEGGMAAIDGAFNKTSQSIKTQLGLVAGSAKDAGTQMATDFNTSVQSMTESFLGEDGKGGFANATKKGWEGIKKAEGQYKTDVEKLETSAGQTLTAISEGLDPAITQTQQLVKDNKELIKAYNKELKKVKAVEDELDNLITKYGEAEQAAKDAATAAYNYEHKEYNQEINDVKNNKGEDIGQSGKQQNNEESKTEEPTVEPTKTDELRGNGKAEVGDEVRVKSSAKKWGSKDGNVNMWSKVPGNKFYIKAVSGSQARIGDPHGPNYWDSGITGWANIKDLEGYDTGGYTGSWSNSGKLAMLHQKELVLNQSDTKNMLNAVSIMRNLSNTLGASMLNRLGNAAAPTYTDGGSGTSLLEQNVHIDATFPNVKNAIEIEEALNNLVNAASQRIWTNR